MRLYRSFLILFSVVFAFTSCGTDHENDINNGGGKTSGVNEYRNVLTIGRPAEVTRLEFPKLKGGTSEVIVHSTSAYGMTYALEWDHAKRSQRWSCYEITSANNKKGWNRKQWNNTKWGGDPFQVDPKIPANEQSPVRGEFSGSHYPNYPKSYFDRGHICASEDRIYAKEANEQTFYMSNMQPQVHVFNAGIWQKMEACIQNNANRGELVYVCKGGTIDKDSQILTHTKSGFIVPRYFFMAVLMKDEKGYHAFGFWVEHLYENHSSDRLSQYVVNIDELERLTGIDFFCNLPDELEHKVEHESVQEVRSYFRSWGIN